MSEMELVLQIVGVILTGLVDLLKEVLACFAV